MTNRYSINKNKKNKKIRQPINQKVKQLQY